MGENQIDVQVVNSSIYGTGKAIIIYHSRSAEQFLLIIILPAESYDSFSPLQVRTQKLRPRKYVVHYTNPLKNPISIAHARCYSISSYPHRQPLFCDLVDLVSTIISY